MMYRVWDKQEKKWLKENKAYISPIGLICVKGIFGKTAEYIPDIRYKTDFCLECKDKNGVTVYQNDIVKYKNVGVIAYSSVLLMYVFLDYEEGKYYPLSRDIVANMEKIGTIHENGDLLPELKINQEG